MSLSIAFVLTSSESLLILPSALLNLSQTGSQCKIFNPNEITKIEEWERVLEWICPESINPEEYHVQLWELVTKETGSWIFQNPSFQQWLNTPGSFLWLQGQSVAPLSPISNFHSGYWENNPYINSPSNTIIPTLFSSSIIYNLIKRRLSQLSSLSVHPRIGLAFFYCHANQSEKQNARYILGSLLKPLIHQAHLTQESRQRKVINTYYDNHRNALRNAVANIEDQCGDLLDHL